ncbi:MAG: hypothetical protein KJO23_08465, partial [Bacteroidia bacterium]|nr:hypothetical protein [Bacteroidia bacterium]
MLTFALVGLWHVANWTFNIFGLFNGVVLVLERIPLFKNKKTLKHKLQAHRWISLPYIFTVFALSALFFRANNIDQALFILERIFSFTMDGAFTTLIGSKLYYLVFLLLAELLTRSKDFPLQQLEAKIPRVARWAVYYVFIIFIIRYAEPKEAFIYFQF